MGLSYEHGQEPPKGCNHSTREIIIIIYQQEYLVNKSYPW